MSRGKSSAGWRARQAPKRYDMGETGANDSRRDSRSGCLSSRCHAAPHPNHPEGGMLFPKFHIDEVKNEEGFYGGNPRTDAFLR